MTSENTSANSVIAPGQGRVVVGDDGSKAAGVALRYAAGLARSLGTDLEIVRAWSVRTAPRPEHAEGGVPTLDELEAAVRADLESDVAKLDCTQGLTVLHTVVRGQSSKVLVEVAADAGILVVGSRGQGGFAGLLMGSTAEQVVRHAGVPTLVVPVDKVADAQ